MIIHLLLLLGLLMATLWTALARALIESAIGLALTSALLTIIMFQFDAPLAGVFELSVCTGLISVVFISTIGLTNPVSLEETQKRSWDRFKRFVYLPFLLLIIESLFLGTQMSFDSSIPVLEQVKDVREVLWHVRQFDMFGQIILLFVGVLGVVIFFKEQAPNER
ncbi:MAG: hypothetical protein WA705_12790 [Candidatus Ozemobacteraceae bacterium]